MEVMRTTRSRAKVPAPEPEPIGLELAHTIPGTWDHWDDDGYVDWLQEELVQANWSDNKWYDVKVLKLLKNRQFDCHFLSTGNVGSVPVERLRLRLRLNSNGDCAEVTAQPTRHPEHVYSLAWHIQTHNPNGKHSFLLQ